MRTDLPLLFQWLRTDLLSDEDLFRKLQPARLPAQVAPSQISAEYLPADPHVRMWQAFRVPASIANACNVVQFEFPKLFAAVA